MFEVVNDFRDAKNDNYLYRVGDKYPAGNSEPSKARIKELAKGKNKYGKVFIKEIEESPENQVGESNASDPNNGEGNAPGEENTEE